MYLRVSTEPTPTFEWKTFIYCIEWYRYIEFLNLTRRYQWQIQDFFHSKLHEFENNLDREGAPAMGIL